LGVFFGVCCVLGGWVWLGFSCFERGFWGLFFVFCGGCGGVLVGFVCCGGWGWVGGDCFGGWGGCVLCCWGGGVCVWGDGTVLRFVTGKTGKAPG